MKNLKVNVLLGMALAAASGTAASGTTANAAEAVPVNAAQAPAVYDQNDGSDALSLSAERILFPDGYPDNGALYGPMTDPFEDFDDPDPVEDTEDDPVDDPGNPDVYGPFIPDDWDETEQTEVYVNPAVYGPFMDETYPETETEAPEPEDGQTSLLAWLMQLFGRLISIFRGE